ncbi:DUF4166 domain-containing protein [Guptibacillus hwajinpoensis]|uniref:DUF4166 domain-containing protein n=1 Tax=Guptibacillus hwajinpoensis TaxID=208199 RepID=A0ABU0JXG5_9BACL|nr:DUF4166 domain-containing protein [Alkalihalobacillus hemicentroti]MDQ0481774.1 hypothetical protein [Alkalihalobacillus hemicentroti]
MSIYKKALGKQFQHLHPRLQKRYEISSLNSFQGSGVMRKISGGPVWLYPFFFLGTNWKLLFPEYGENISFVIKNTPRKGKNGEEQVHWERIFYFGKKKRYFNALMSFDEERSIIKDYLGEPALMYSDLAFNVDETTGSITIQSQDQRLVLGRWEIPLPRIFQGLAAVTESYIEKEKAFHIKVKVENPIIGSLFSYEGVFRDDASDKESISD